MRISSWLNSGTKRNPIPAGGPVDSLRPAPALDDAWADALLEAYRSRAPGQFLSNKLALAQAMRGVAYLAINTLATQFSTGKFEKAEVVITAYGETSEQAEAVGRAVLARLEDPLFVSQPPRQTIDCRPQDDATTAESERGKDGLFRYAVPLTVRTTVYVPRS